MKLYVTFGQGQRIHKINGVVYDKNCVCVITASTKEIARKFVREYFDENYSMEYVEKDFKKEWINKYYPRGLIHIN